MDRAKKAMISTATPNRCQASATAAFSAKKQWNETILRALIRHPQLLSEAITK